METKLPMRAIRKAPPRQNYPCSCGLPRVFVVEIRMRQRYPGGERIVTHRRSFCETHGRAYALKFHLEVPNGETAI